MVLHGIVLLASARAVSRKTPTYFIIYVVVCFPPIFAPAEPIGFWSLLQLVVYLTCVIFVSQTHFQLVVYQEAVVALKLLVEHIFCAGRSFEGVSFYSFIKEKPIVFRNQISVRES